MQMETQRPYTMSELIDVVKTLNTMFNNRAELMWRSDKFLKEHEIFIDLVCAFTPFRRWVELECAILGGAPLPRVSLGNQTIHVAFSEGLKQELPWIAGLPNLFLIRDESTVQRPDKYRILPYEGVTDEPAP